MRKLLVALLVLAAGFSASLEGTISPGSITVYKGNSTNFTVSITNTGTETVDVKLAITGDITWILPFNNILRLSPGQRGSRTIGFSSSARSGSYLYTVSARIDGKSLWDGNVLINVKGPAEEEPPATPEKESTFIISSDPETPPASTILLGVRASKDLLPATVEISLLSEDGPVYQTSGTLDAEEKNFKIEIPPGQEAGNYTIRAYVVGKNIANTTVVRVIRVENVEVNEEVQKRLLGKKVVLTAQNKGNVPAQKVVEKHISAFERPIIDASPAPEIERDGTSYILRWSVAVAPGETKTIATYTVDYIPYSIIGVLLAIAIVLIIQKPEPIEVRKDVKYVEGKDGRTHIRVELSVVNSSDGPLEDVVVREIVPSIASVSKARIIKAKARKTERGVELIWELGKMMPGEERLFGYEMALKFGIIGKLELAKPEVSWKE